MTFRYRVVKKSVGNAPYTTRPELGQPLTEAEVLREIEAATSITAGDVKNALTALRRLLLVAALNGRPSEPLFELLRIGLASGGALEDPGQPLTIEEVDPRMRIYLASSVQREFRSQISLERMGVDGDRLPEIELVRNLGTGALDTYTPGNVLRITGDDLKIVKSDSEQGVFLTGEGGTIRRMETYIDNTSGTLTVLIPVDLQGPQRLSVRVKFGPNLRESLHPTTLVEEVAT